MKPEAGSCYAAHRRWHYNSMSGTCEKFIYGGCEGNPNNFISRQECEEACYMKEKMGEISGPPPLPPGICLSSFVSRVDMLANTPGGGRNKQISEKRGRYKDI